MSTELKLIAGTLASQCYPSSPQILYNEMFARGSALLGDITGIIISESAPDANDRDKGWIKLNGATPTSPPVVYTWYNGNWLAAHPSTASGDERRLWVGDTSTLETFDGGSSGTVGDTTGPMWEVDTAFAGRFPIAPGSVPSANPSVTVAVGDTGGSPQTTLAGNQMAPHQHIVPVCAIDANTTDPATNGSPATVQYGIGKSQGTGDVVDESSNEYARSFPLTSSYPDTAVTTQQPVVTLPPYRGVYLIKRTARIYYVGA